MKTFIILAMTLTMSYGSFKTYQENVVNIEGNGEIKVVPDMAYIKVGTSSKSNDVDSAIIQTADSYVELKKILKKYKIKEKDIYSEDISVSETYEWKDRERISTGYKAEKMYKITWRNIAKIEDFAFEVTQAGTNFIDRIEFTHSKKDSLGKELINIAIDDANVIKNKIAKMKKTPSVLP